MCQSIYGLTPSNLINPISNMLNEDNLGINLCSVGQSNNNIEHFKVGSGFLCDKNKDCKSNTCIKGLKGKFCL